MSCSMHVHGPERSAGRLCAAAGAARSAHLARVEELARSLVAGHRRHLWVGSQEHAEWDECVWCDVLRRASELALGARR